MKSTEVHVISGLGTDERVFKGIKVKGIHFKFLKWLPPNPGENISSYARRFPFRYIQRSLQIRRGGHFMIMENAEEISALLSRIWVKHTLY